MYDGKIQQIGKLLEIDQKPLNYLVAKIMGIDNVWPVEFITNDKKGSILSVPIGKIQLDRKVQSKISGIKINPSSFSIYSDKTKNKDDLIIFQGTVKSVVELDNETFRLIVDIKDTLSEYIKVDCLRDQINKELNVDTSITLAITPKDVVLI